MSDLESLFGVLLVIYLADCLLFLRRGSVLFRRRTREWEIFHPDSALSNAQGGVLWSNPWPTFPTTFIASLPPLVLSPDGLLNWTPFCLEHSGRPLPVLSWFRWDEVRAVACDRRSVLVNGKTFLNAVSSADALQIADRITSLKAAEPSARARLVEEWIHWTLDPAAVNARIDEVDRELSRIRIPSQILAFFLFVLSPVLIYRWGLIEVGWWLLLGIYLQSAGIAFCLHRGHRRLYPHDADDRFVKVATALLAPLSAVRSPDTLARYGLLGFHPLAVARSLCGDSSFRAFARRMGRDLHFPILPDSPSRDEPLLAALSWSAMHWRKSVARLTRGAGLTDEELLAPPVRSDGANRTYCPRCLEQFTTEEARCVECGNRPTVPWPARKPSVGASAPGAADPAEKKR